MILKCSFHTKGVSLICHWKLLTILNPYRCIIKTHQKEMLLAKDFI